ncbi:acyl-CoA dehydrogenase family protein [Actinomadura viridis]|uniref:Alkylation response protein AidB-like acyl-CoA dehydrogenase n=1 Tax=Actinomadura viridis TaxID=58110 RepID=A0A931DF04_9ACTN|nr:acyl-CoA dehydrogenase family protein [Actinomadura viridis]MBG6088885.1 alkylation response protein AidB-like acyl-CoA dehydrogenase [Actinomadura viridis]
MHFALSEDQRVLQRTTDEICAQLFAVSPVGDARADGGALRAKLWSKLAELDLVGLLVPEHQGGAGGSLTDACVVAEALGRHIAPVPYVGTAIAAAALLRFGDGPDESLARLCRGDAYSVLLDGGLDDPAGTATVAFDWVDGALGVALSPDGRATVHDLVDVDPITDVDPLHRLARVRPVPAGEASGDGARRARAVAWTGAAALLTGLADGALRQSVDYAREREQYDRPIGSFQAVKHLCADMLFDVETSRSITYGASWAAEHAPIDEAERVASAAKAHAGAAAIRVCETGIQVLGGIGVTQEHDAHLRLRCAHLHHAAFGNSDAPLVLLAGRLLEKV